MIGGFVAPSVRDPQERYLRFLVQLGVTDVVGSGQSHPRLGELMDPQVALSPACRWSPFGNLAAVAFNTQHDGRVYVFDPTETPSLQAPMGVQDASIRAIEWLDHQTLATGDASGQVRFWVLKRRA